MTSALHSTGLHPREYRVYVGLGSNLDNPEHQVRTACSELGRIPESRCMAYSSLYLSAPLGPQDQPDFVNAVVALDTELAPHALLRELQAIEDRHGRVRGAERWGPRTLDIDLLLYGDLQIEDEILTLPHPGLPARNFVLYPLQEIAPGLEIAGMGSLTALISRCPAVGLQVLQA